MNYLIENKFTSKAKMAESLAGSKRNVQRILNGTSTVKGRNSALGQILLHFANHGISSFRTWRQFAVLYGDLSKSRERIKGKSPIPKPDDLSQDGLEVFRAFIMIVDEMSEFMCGQCVTLCTPNQFGYQLWGASCSLGDIATIVC